MRLNRARPVKVAYVIGQLTTGGSEGQLYTLLKNLDRKTFTPSVCSLSGGGYWAGPIRDLGVEVVEIERKSSLEVRRLARLTGVLRKWRPDIVHTILAPGNMYGRLASLLLGRKRPVLIASERGFDISDGALHRMVHRVLLPFTSAYLTNSLAVKRFLVERWSVPAEKIRVIYNGVDLSVFSAAGAKDTAPVKDGARDKVVTAIARLSEEKDFPTLLAAAKIVLGRKDDVLFYLVGEGPRRGEIEGMIKGMALTDKVLLPGVSHDVPGTLSRTDIFVLSSHRESLPNTVLEAMAAAKPVIATDVGGCSELVSDGESGYLVPPGSPEPMAEAMLKLLDDEGLAERMGATGRRTVEKKFRIEKMVSETERLYLALLGSKDNG